MSKQSRFHAGVTKSVQSLNLVADVLRLVLYIFVYFLYFVFLGCENHFNIYPTLSVETVNHHYLNDFLPCRLQNFLLL